MPSNYTYETELCSIIALCLPKYYFMKHKETGKIKHFIVAFALFFALFVPTAVFAADTYVVDPGHSRVGFTVKHLVISKVSGNFKEFEGAIVFDEKDASKCSVNGTIKTASVDSDNANRDNDLRGDGFFEVEKYPTITFQSTKVEKKGEQYLVTGKLTMKNVTREIVLPVKVSGPILAFGGKKRIGIEGSTTINRQDYGLTWNKAIEGVGLVVSDEVELNINAEAAVQ